MKRINYDAVSYLVGDAVADIIVKYTARLASSQLADAVDINVLGPDGNAEMASFALGPGVAMTAETTRSELKEPDNSAALAYIEGRMQSLRSMPIAPMTEDDLRSMADAFDGADGTREL